jgi:hypothetical protein
VAASNRHPRPNTPPPLHYRPPDLVPVGCPLGSSSDRRTSSSPPVGQARPSRPTVQRHRLCLGALFLSESAKAARSVCVFLHRFIP